MNSKLLCWKQVTNIIYMTLQLSSKLLCCWQQITNSILNYHYWFQIFEYLIIDFKFHIQFLVYLLWVHIFNYLTIDPKFNIYMTLHMNSQSFFYKQITIFTLYKNSKLFKWTQITNSYTLQYCWWLQIYSSGKRWKFSYIWQSKWV
jgi:hypothetical protein